MGIGDVQKFRALEDRDFLRIVGFNIGKDLLQPFDAFHLQVVFLCRQQLLHIIPEQDRDQAADRRDDFQFKPGFFFFILPDKARDAFGHRWISAKDVFKQDQVLGDLFDVFCPAGIVKFAQKLGEIHDDAEIGEISGYAFSLVEFTAIDDDQIAGDCLVRDLVALNNAFACCDEDQLHMLVPVIGEGQSPFVASDAHHLHRKTRIRHGHDII